MWRRSFAYELRVDPPAELLATVKKKPR